MQSIIVYRNPAEAMFWEGGYAFPIFVGCAVGFVTFLMLHQLFVKFFPAKRSYFKQVSDVQMWIISILSLLAGFGVFHWMMI